ncbi:helix-turn-helix domain-containing protein [Paenibacillus chartarius]|uniref:Helix-turn-helix domain-containing protein n=1 Tax=Paenibacillus chartarius TaxID=747481 RepID=A0ABV6DTA1_9BACL
MAQPLAKWLKYNLAHSQTRLVLILTFSVFLIILAVSMTSYYTSKSVLQDELSEPQKQMLQLNMSVIDDSVKESDQVAIQVALNGNVYKFLTSDVQNSYANISAIYELLSTLIGNSKFIKSIYIYDIAHESFVGLPQGYSSSKVTFVDSDWIGVKDEFGGKTMVIKKREVPEGAGGKGSEVTLFRKIAIQGDFKGIVAVNLKSEELFAKLNPQTMNNLNRMRYILDENDEVLYSVSNYEFDEEAIRQVLAELKEDGGRDITHRDRKLLVNRIVSPTTGWKYISIVDQESLLAQSQKVRNVVLSVSVAALALGGATILYINAAAFRPVRRLKQLFSSYGGKTDGSVEGIDLEKLAGDLLRGHARMTQLVQETMSEASSKFVHDAYTGKLSGRRELKEKWNRYFAEWTTEPVTAAVLSIDRYGEWSRTFTVSDQSLLKFALANITAELFEPQWRIVCTDFGKDKMIILLQPREAELQPEKRMAECLEVVSRLLKFSISAGVSTPQTDTTRLRQAMLEADNALTYRLYQGYGRVIGFSEVSGHEAEEQPEDGELEALVRMIETGDEQGCLEAVERLTANIRRSYSYPSAAIAFLLSVFEEIERLQPKADVMFEPLREKFDTLDLSDISGELSGLAITVARKFRRLIESKDFITCHRMIDYMKQHLGEPIGIPEIAEAAGISSSLASQVFKQETGETIYNYLTQLRMDRAAELLVRTDNRISDIAVMVGYQHENSFIRSFRKFKDITPGKYRDMMRTRMDALPE